METQLTIKHLAAYLPYGLKAVNEIRNFTVEIKGLQTDNDVIHNLGKSPIKFIKPILRPLSDLTKEIEVNGEKFVPMMELFMLIHDYHLVVINNGKLDYSDNNITYQIDDEYNHCITFKKEETTLSYDKYEQRFNITQGWNDITFNYIEMHNKLLEWHFNVFNLPENLFVDINTLEK